MSTWVRPLLQLPDGRKPVVTSEFGDARSATPAQKAHIHAGVDVMYERLKKVPKAVFQADHGSTKYFLEEGSPVVAASDGTVSWTGSSLHGLSLIINHTPSLQTFYQHLDRIDVKKRAHAVTGQQIGIAGYGHNGPPIELIRHLHFEIRIDKKPIDPEPSFNKWGCIKTPTGGYVTDAMSGGTYTYTPNASAGVQSVVRRASGVIAGVDRGTAMENMTGADIRAANARYAEHIAQTLDVQQSAIYAALAGFQGVDPVVKGVMTFDFTTGTWLIGDKADGTT